MTVYKQPTMIFNKSMLMDIQDRHIPNGNSDIENMQCTFDPSYTKKLASSRGPVYSNLSKSLRIMIQDYIMKNDNVLEFGPGYDDILYKLLGPLSKKSNWFPLDINKYVTDNLQKKATDNYTPINANMRELPFNDEYFDVACGLCSLDSVVDYYTIGKEFNRTLKKNGYLIHIQDFNPSDASTVRLMMEEDEFVEICGDFTDPPQIFGIREGMRFTKANHYLNKSIAKVFKDSGLNLILCGEVQFSDTFSSKYCNSYVNFFNKEFNLPDYSILIMQKR